MRTAAILPVKRFSQAKQRLSDSVVSRQRLELARAMVGDVLTTLQQVPELELTVVVTGESAVAAAASYLGLMVVDDERDSGQSAAATRGIRRAMEAGADRVLLVPGDCPALDPAELSALLSKPVDPPEVVILPDRHRTGTNGLLLSPPDVIAPSFGPGSCARHGEIAAASGASCRVEPIPSLMLDVDTGDDLQVLRERLAEHPERAARTRAVLAGAGGRVPA